MMQVRDKSKFSGVDITSMEYEYPQSTLEFILTFAEAMANHAYGGDFVSVRTDPEDICTALVTLSTSHSREVRFDYLGYFTKSKEMFGEEGQSEVTGVLLDFMSDRGIV